MKHVLLPGDVENDRASVGTNVGIEQPFAPVAANHPPKRPNVLIINAYDLTTASFAAYGGRGPTPRLDRLAKSGVRFSEAYADSADVRGNEATLLTGLNGAGRDPARQRSTLLELLVRSGYDTTMSGDTTARRDVSSDTAAITHFIGTHRNAPFAAYVRLGQEQSPSDRTAADGTTRVDEAVGALITSLRRASSYRSTLVLLVGANCDSDDRRIPMVASWPGQLPPRQRHDNTVYVSDWMPTIASIGRANVDTADGVDLSEHLLVGGAVPDRVRAAVVRAA